MRKITRHKNTAITGFEQTRTEQSHSQQCDMNYILRDYARTGIFKHSHKNQGRYDDVSNIDFQTAQNIVADSKSLFESMPALVQQQFNHETGKFLEFCRNPENGAAMQELGITAGIDGIDAQGELIAEMQTLVSALAPKNNIAEGDDPATQEIA